VARASVGAAAGRFAGGCHRPRPRVRHGRASDNAAMRRVASPASKNEGACSTSAAGSGCSRSAAARLGFDQSSQSTTTRSRSRSHVQRSREPRQPRCPRRRCSSVGRYRLSMSLSRTSLLRPVEAILARLETRVVITSGYLAGERPQARGWKARTHLELDGWSATCSRANARKSAGGFPGRQTGHEDVADADRAARDDIRTQAAPVDEALAARPRVRALQVGAWLGSRRLCTPHRRS